MSDRPDPWILTLTSFLVVCGVVFVFDTSYFFSSYKYNDSFRMILKHGSSIVIGALLLLLGSRCQSDWLQRYAPHTLVVAVLCLAATLIPGVGVCANGACRWISLGVFNFQPAEVVKIAFVLATAAWLTTHVEKLGKFRYGMLPTIALMGFLGVILLQQPDFGSAALIGLLGAALMFLAGVPIWQVLGLGVLLGGSATALIVTSEYRLRRVLDFLNPEADIQGGGWQLHQAKIAFGSGELWGQGLGGSTQKSGWLPEAHTDFIFSVIGEETGLVGASFVLALFAVLAYRGYRIAHRHPTMFGQMVAAGLTLVITLQAMINMGVVLGLLPTKGIGLPFISYGGSSMMVFLAVAGLLMSLSRELRER